MTELKGSGYKGEALEVLQNFFNTITLKVIKDEFKKLEYNFTETFILLRDDEEIQRNGKRKQITDTLIINPFLIDECEKLKCPFIDIREKKEGEEYHPNEEDRINYPPSSDKEYLKESIEILKDMFRDCYVSDMTNIFNEYKNFTITYKILKNEKYRKMKNDRPRISFSRIYNNDLYEEVVKFKSYVIKGERNDQSSDEDS